MNMDDKYHKILPSLELLLDYLDGLLEEDSAKKIEMAIGESDELKSIVEGIKLYYENEGQDRDKLELYIDQVRIKFQSRAMINDHSAQTPGSKVFNWLKVAAVLAFILVAGLLLIYNFISPDVDEMIAGQIENRYDAPIAFRNGESTNELIWSKVLNAYEQKNYDDALNYLDKIPVNDERYIDGQFYKGLCLLYMNPVDYEKSIRYLSFVSESEHRLKEPADWFLALAYFKNNNQKQAADSFQKIVHENLYKKKEAKQIFSLLSE